MTATLQRIPELDLDLFAEASLRDPSEDYRALRDAGRLVRLNRPEVYAIGRFDDVQAALRDDKRLISGEGVPIPGHPTWHLAPKRTGRQGLSLGAICEQLQDRRRNGAMSLAELQRHNEPRFGPRPRTQHAEAVRRVDTSLDRRRGRLSQTLRPR